MATFNLSQSFPLYTQRLVDIYHEKNKPTNFLRSYFPTKVVPTKLISYMISRGFEQVAVDVWRGDEGKRTQWTQSTEKIIEPLYFRYNFDLTTLQAYDSLFAPQTMQITNAPQIMMLLDTIIEKQLENQYLIERAIEIMCAQVLQTGKITMSSQGTGIEIDYKRKSASFLTPSAYWDGAGDPFAQIKTQCDFLRTVGKVTGKTFDVICGEDALSAFLNNTIVKARQNLFNYAPDALVMPSAQAESIGSSEFGVFSAGPYKCRLISYPQYYDTVSGNTATATPYLDPKKVTILPSNSDMKFATYFGAIPQVVQPGSMPVIGDFIAWDWQTPDRKAHLYEVESAPLVVPVKIDQIANIQALAV